MQEVSTHRKSMSLWIWEGLEEAQVSETLQSAARATLAISGRDTVTNMLCLKPPITLGRIPNEPFARTQEDLSSTSQRLQRYELLLDQITPMVSPDVQAIIDQARREQVSSNKISHQRAFLTHVAAKYWRFRVTRE